MNPGIKEAPCIAGGFFMNKKTGLYIFYNISSCGNALHLTYKIFSPCKEI